MKRFFALLCCAVPIALFGAGIYDAGGAERASRQQFTDLTTPNSDSEKIIDFIVKEDLQSAANIFLKEDFKNSCDENLYTYFENFFTLISESEKSQINETYFIRASNVVENYLKNLGYSDAAAFRLSESIPYYVAKHYVQHLGTWYSGKWREKASFARAYRENFTKLDSLSRETADLICFYFYAYYMSSTTNEDWLKSEINEISAVQQRYAFALGENGTYETQKTYLQNLSSFLERKANSLIDRPLQLLKLGDRLESCPEYTF